MSINSVPHFGAGTPPRNLKRSRRNTPIKQEGEASGSTQPPARRVKREVTPDVIVKKEESPSPGLRRSPTPDMETTKSLVSNFFKTWSFPKKKLTPQETAQKENEFQKISRGVRKQMDSASDVAADLEVKPYFESLAQNELNSKRHGKRKTTKDAARQEMYDLFGTIKRSEGI